MNISDRYKLWKKRKNNSYHHGGRIDVLIESYNNDTLSDEERTELLGILEERSNTPLPDFNRFSKEFMDNAITSGMDTYIYTGITDAETYEKKVWDRGHDTTMGQRQDDILGSINPDGVTGELIHEDYRLDGTTVDLAPVVTKTRQGFTAYTTKGEHMFDSYGNPVPTFKTREELNDWLKTEVYKDFGHPSYIKDQTHVNVPGCGDNMTCITSATNNTINMIKAWNIAIKDKNSPYYCPTCKPLSDGDLRGQSDDLLAMSHLKFWGVDGGYRPRDGEWWEGGEGKQKIWEKAGFKQNRMYERDFYTNFGEDDEELNPEAIVNFLQQQQYGNIMGVHGSHHGKDRYDTPGHAIQYMGGAFLTVKDNSGEYKRIPLNFDSKEAIQNSLNLLNRYKGEYDMKDIGFLAANDPTEFEPLQYFGENMQSMFSQGDYTDPGSRSIRFTTFQGGEGYQQNLNYLLDQQELYKNIYGDLGGTNWGTNYQSLGSNDLMVNAQKSQELIEKNRTDGLGEVEENEEVQEQTGWFGLEDMGITETLSEYWNRLTDFQRGAEVPRYEDGGYIKKDLKKFMNGLAKPPSYNHGGPHDPNIENNVRSQLYPVQIIQYPYGHSSMNSGHIESKILSTHEGNDVVLPLHLLHVENDGTIRSLKPGDPGTYVNAWVDGNRPVDFKRDPGDPDHDNIRSVIVNLTAAELEEYISGAHNTKKSSGGLSDKTTGIGNLLHQIIGQDMQIPLGDKGYNFITNNCGDHVCNSLNIDAKDTGKILELTTDPTNVFDYIINPDSGFNIQEGSIKGNRVDRGNFLVDPNLSLFDIHKDILRDLVEIEKKGYNYEDIAKWDMKTLQEKLPNVGNKLQDMLSSNLPSDMWEGIATNLINQINVENLVNTVLDPDNLSAIKSITEAVESGNLEGIDAGDAVKLYIESTGAGDVFDKLGWLGDYMKWKYSFMADAVQNTAEFVTDTYEGIGNIVSYIEDNIQMPLSDHEKRSDLSVGNRLWIDGKPSALLVRGEWTNRYGSIMIGQGSNSRYVWKSPTDPGRTLIPPVSEYSNKEEFKKMFIQNNPNLEMDQQEILNFIKNSLDYKNGGNVSNLQNKLFL